MHHVQGYDGLTQQFEKVNLKEVFGKIVICDGILIFDYSIIFKIIQPFLLKNIFEKSDC